MAGMLFAITLSFVNAGSVFAETKDTEEKVYRDDDLSKSKIDPDQSTLNKMQGEQGSEGKAAGGTREDDKSKMKSKGDETMEPVEKYPEPSY